MVGKTFTIVAAVLVTLCASGAAMAQSYVASAQTVARATILRPAILRTSGQIMRFDTAMVTDHDVHSQRLVRPCAIDQGSRCTMIVFDLP